MLTLNMLGIFMHSYPILQDSIFTDRVENSVDPDQLVYEKPADQNPHSFQNRKNSLDYHGKGSN